MSDSGDHKPLEDDIPEAQYAGNLVNRNKVSVSHGKVLKAIRIEWTRHVRSAQPFDGLA